MKMQIRFWFEKNFKFASNEDANPFLFWEKLRSASNEDVDLFLFWEKFRSTSNEDVDQLLFEKILDLHLMKMQVHFYF